MAHMRSDPNGTEDTGLAPAVDWEPCPDFTPDAAEPGVCAGCGWLEDDHVVDVPRAA
jgi:hypothetical protein